MDPIQLSPRAVLVLVASANDDGPHVDININQEWWATAHKDHRKALFIACIEATGAMGQRVIPEEFSVSAMRPLDKIPDPPDREALVSILVAQVEAALTVVAEGGDLRRANLDDRLFTDRIRDTIRQLRATP